MKQKQEHADEPETNIRICATQPPYTVFVTWYKDGRVERFDRATEMVESLGSVRFVEELNVILYDAEIMPVGFGRKGRKYGD